MLHILGMQMQSKTVVQILKDTEPNSTDFFIFLCRFALICLNHQCCQSTCCICQLRSLSNCLQLNRVYDSWRALAYPSLKPLGAWFQDLLSRMRQLVEWTNDRTLWLNKLADKMYTIFILRLNSSPISDRYFI